MDVHFGAVQVGTWLVLRSRYLVLRDPPVVIYGGMSYSAVGRGERRVRDLDQTGTPRGGPCPLAFSSQDVLDLEAGCR